VTGAEIAAALKGAPEGKGWRCLCPAHDDHTPSLSITEKNGKVLVTCRAGCSQDAVIEALRQRRLWPDKTNPGSSAIEDIYDYRDEAGKLLFQVCRTTAKSFPARRRDGNGGWTWGIGGVRRVPYRLPELIATPTEETVYIAEGEKDCINLAKAFGVATTCNPGGAAKPKPDGKLATPKWRAEYNRYFVGRDVVILPDNDDVGRAHAKAIAQNLAMMAARVRIVALPGLPAKGDVSDWLSAGGSLSDLETLVELAPLYRCAATQHDPAEDCSNKVSGNGGEPPLVIDGAAPYDVARLFRSTRFEAEGRPALFHHRDAFYSWDGAAYPEIGEKELRAQLYEFLDQCVTLDTKREAHPFKPNKSRVTNILDGLQAAANLPATVSAPVWLDQAPDLAPADIIPCTNGLLHLPTRKLLPHTPLFFIHNALDFAYEATAPVPGQWIEFLSQLWPNDPESIETLQEIFGLCLTADTRQQKAFLLIGPKRSGKGTIARVLVALVGRCNAVSPTLTSLGERFGLEPLIGKLVAIISDARLGAKADQHGIAESLLRITGEDDVTADRKFRQAWTGAMRVRFVIISNELPRLADTSGALASRFILLKLTESFYSREDHGLIDRLLGESPGILNWSIEGLRRLRNRGYFVQPASATEAVQGFEDLASPVGAFLRDRCDIGPGRTVEINRLFEVWCEWCKMQGRDHPGTAQSFGRDLRAACSALTTTNPLRTETGRLRFYEGVGLK
jgi:putative DNA primase/helicase